MKQRIVFLSLPVVAATFLLLFALWILMPQSVQAASYTVGGRCGATIQACVDWVNDGDTVVVPAGTWTESLTLKRPVSLTGESRATTIIQAVRGQRVLTVTGVTVTNEVVISELTLTGGDVSASNICFPIPENCGGGLLIMANATPRLTNLIIADNQAYRGGGLYAEEGSPLILDNVVISGNISVLSGGGASLGSGATISNSQFINNESSNNVGGGLRVQGDTFLFNSEVRDNRSICPSTFSICHAGGLYGFEVNISVVDSLFKNNSCSGDDCDGGGLYLGSSFVTVTLAVTNSEFISNTAGRSGGGFSAGSFRIQSEISNSQFERNQATLGQGGGFYSYQAIVTGSNFLSNTVGATNTFDDGGGGFAVRTSAVVTNAFFSGNHSDLNGGGFAAFLGPVSVYNSQFVDNTATNNGGAFFVEVAGAHVTDSSFTNNSTLVAEIINDDNVGNGGAIWLNGDTTLTNVTVDGNQATNRGGGLFLPAGSSIITISNSIFSDNSALGSEIFGDGGGAVHVTNRTLLLQANQFVGNEALPAGGGAIYTVGTITETNGLFQNNQALFGGGIYAGNSTLTTHFSATQFISNTAVNTGGGAFMAGPSVYTDVLFLQNSSTGTDLGQGSGAGLRASEAVTLTRVHFISNTAAGSGGGAAIFAPVSMTDTLFQGNHSGNRGGGLQGTFDLITINNAQFISNTATTNGGGLQANGSIKINDTFFAANQSGNAGGALYTSGSVWITDTSVISNSAAGNGGGLYINSNLAAWHIVVQGNSSGGHGGGIYEGSIVSSFEGNTLSNNLAAGDGGGMYVRFRMEADANNRFEANVANGAGGGLYMGRQWLFLSESVFVDNQATIGGGLIITTTAPGTTGHSLINILFASNSASTAGAAIYYNSTRPIDLIHATIADTATNPTSAIAVNNGTVVISNTIIASHTVGIAQISGTVTANANLYYGNIVDQSGTINGNNGNQFGNPGFMNPATDDYHIGAGAAIDTGLDAGVFTDIDGDSRPSGAGFDMGFDEAYVDLVISKVVAPAGPVQPGAPITYTLQFSNVGSSTAQNVVITDTLPAHLTGVSYQSGGAAIMQTNVGTLTYTWSVEDLLPGSSGVITLSGILDPAQAEDGMITNTVSIGSDVESNLADNTALAAIEVVVPRIAFATMMAAAAEASGSATVTVALDIAPITPVTVVYSSTDGTAKAGVDYIGVNEILTVPAGEQSATFTVTLIVDQIVEDDETLNLLLLEPAGAALASPAAAVLTILDDDSEGVLIDPIQLYVTETAATDMYTVSLASQPNAPVTITIQTGGQTTVAPATVTFDALNWSEPQTLTVAAIYDGVFEGDHADVISHTASSPDPVYDGIYIDTVMVSITDRSLIFLPIVELSEPYTVTAPANGKPNLSSGGRPARSVLIQMGNHLSQQLLLLLEQIMVSDLAAQSRAAVWTEPRRQPLVAQG